MTVSGLALDWYAAMPGVVGGACFRQARRVPRLDRNALAFLCHPRRAVSGGRRATGPRFWCLPSDPEADHPDAEVVAARRTRDVLRREVRAACRRLPGRLRRRAKLARRHLLGAFFDGLDTGVWYGGPANAGAAPEVLRLGALVLPGSTAEFADRSTVYQLTDTRGREQLSRRRVGCCYYYKVTEGGEACATCPRVTDAERVKRYAEYE